MAGEGKARGQRWRYSGQAAAGEIVDTTAATTMKVVVMSFAGDLVPGGFSWYLDHGEPTLGDQGADVAVDGCHADAVHLPLRGEVRLLRREGPAGLFKGGTESVFLAGAAKADSHGRGLRPL